MDIYSTEEQQWEAIKKWFERYGQNLLWVVTIVLFLIAGTMYWRHHQEVVREKASEDYMALMGGMDASDEVTIRSKAVQLQQEYPRSPYATLGALALAAETLEHEDVEKAKVQLEWIIKDAKQPGLQAIARIRLMRLYIAENKLDEALDLFDEKKAAGFLTLMAELKGDILFAKGDINGAKQAYEKAYKAAPEEAMHGPLLIMKMDNLGISKEEANS